MFADKLLQSEHIFGSFLHLQTKVGLHQVIALENGIANNNVYSHYA